MDTIQSLYMKILHEFEPQANFLREKSTLVNQQLINSLSPLQLIAITAIATTCGLSIYQFLFSHDEDISTRIQKIIFGMARRLPNVKRKIAEARESTLKTVCNDLAKSVAGHEFTKVLPEKGLSQCQVYLS
ncbi:unnamed protein product [Rotaria sp. Silwood2]|nr:unnamed protein product [Rotaria sp. Silwood2]